MTCLNAVHKIDTTRLALNLSGPRQTQAIG